MAKEDTRKRLFTDSHIWPVLKDILRVDSWGNLNEKDVREILKEECPEGETIMQMYQKMTEEQKAKVEAYLAAHPELQEDEDILD